jgi:hypothetical protein
MVKICTLPLFVIAGLQNKPDVKSQVITKK